MDHVADEVHEQPQEPITNHVNVDTEGFPGGPYDITVLMSYGYHVAHKVWAGEVVICSII